MRRRSVLLSSSSVKFLAKKKILVYLFFDRRLAVEQLGLWRRGKQIFISHKSWKRKYLIILRIDKLLRSVLLITLYFTLTLLPSRPFLVTLWSVYSSHWWENLLLILHVFGLHIILWGDDVSLTFFVRNFL